MQWWFNLFKEAFASVTPFPLCINPSNWETWSEADLVQRKHLTSDSCWPQDHYIHHQSQFYRRHHHHHHYHSYCHNSPRLTAPASPHQHLCHRHHYYQKISLRSSTFLGSRTIFSLSLQTQGIRNKKNIDLPDLKIINVSISKKSKKAILRGSEALLKTLALFSFLLCGPHCITSSSAG